MKRKLVIFLFYIFLITGNLFSQSGWIPQNSGTSENLNAIKFIDDNLGWAIGNNGVVLKTTNGGVNWISINTGSSFDNSGISVVSSSIVYIGTSNNSLLRTTDGGSSWTNIEAPLYGSTLSISFYSLNNGFITGYAGSIEGTSNACSSWELGFVYSIPVPLKSMVFFLNNSRGWFIDNYQSSGVTRSDVFKTSDGGNNWNNISNFQHGNIINSIHFVSTTDGYSVGDNGSINKTSNGGINWTSQISNTNSKLNSGISVNSNISYIAGENGIILHSTNGGSNWINQVSGTNTSLNSVYFGSNPNSGWIAGNSGLILQTSNGGVGIKIISLNNPIDYQLFQNYPNPFNPTTKIVFDIPRNSNVHLYIYDIAGKLVLDLYNNKLSPGKYEYTFKADNFSSGIYFYNLTTDLYSSTKKMILLK